jgi:predicted Zn-dependent protease with MMP-like domain
MDVILNTGKPVDNASAVREHDLMKRMSLEEFGKIVAKVMDSLPGRWRPYLQNIVVDVQEEPDYRTLRRAGFSKEEIAAGESLYGLFVPLNLGSAWGSESLDIRDVPHQILIFKRTLEESFPRRKELMIEIRKTVIHELAHHFGYTDRDLEEFDDNPNPFDDEIG